MTGGDTKALNKMMEAGQLDPNELLPKMATYMDKMSEANNAYQIALGTSIVAQGRMNFQFEKFVGIFSKNGGERGFAKIFNSLSELMGDNHDVAIRLGKAWEKLGTLFKGVLNSLDILSDKFVITEGGFIGLAAAGLMMINPFTKILTVFSGLMLIMEDLYVYSQGGSSVFGQWMEGLDGETFQVMKDFLADIQNLGDQTSITIDKITTSFGKLIEALGESGVAGAVFRSTVSSLGFMVDHLTTLVTMAGMVAQGDLMGAAKVGAERGLSVMNSAADLAATALRGGNGMTIPKPSVGDDFLANLSARNPNMTGEMLKQRMSQQAASNQITFGDLNMTFSGTPDQLMDSKGEELKQWFTTQLKTAIVNTPVTE